MDKIGHLTTAASLGEFAYGLNRWTGLEREKAIWMGGGSALLYLTTIEVFDGFSKEWGASTGDIVGNTAGAAFFVAQQLAWDEQRFLLKFSFYPSTYAKYNPEKLGRNILQNSLKDYNAQTYWLSSNIRSFLGKESKFPGWINVALGYSGDGMLGAKSNPAVLDGESLPYYKRQSQYLLSLDVDLRRIKTRSDLLKLVFHCLGFVKLPFPALEYSSGGTFRFYYLYY
jgi:hypothetical protein